MANSAADTISATNFAAPISAFVFSKWYTGADFLNIVGSRSRQARVLSVSQCRRGCSPVISRNRISSFVAITGWWEELWSFVVAGCDDTRADVHVQLAAKLVGDRRPERIRDL